MKAEDFKIDMEHGTIRPLAAGQRFTHREYGQNFVIKEVKTNDYGEIVIVKDKERSWPDFADEPTWGSVEDMFMFLKFVDWAYNEPFKLDMSRFPHKCPRCTMPAYVGACGGGDVDCSNADCPTKKR